MGFLGRSDLDIIGFADTSSDIILLEADQHCSLALYNTQGREYSLQVLGTDINVGYTKLSYPFTHRTYILNQPEAIYITPDDATTFIYLGSTTTRSKAA